jgi:DnaJ-domain-containing protein 1
MTTPKKPAGKMGWLDFAFGVASKAAKKLHAEFEAGKAGLPSPSQPPPSKSAPRPAQAPLPGPPWWEVLRVPRTASLPEVTAAYRDLMAKSHPDKVAHLSEQIRRVAGEETRKINAAYEAARREVNDRKSRAGK